MPTVSHALRGSVGSEFFIHGFWMFGDLCSTSFCRMFGARICRMFGVIEMKGEVSRVSGEVSSSIPSRRPWALM